MVELNDAQLLEQFTREHSQQAFAELASRHRDWVYCAALRMVRDPALAQDVSQAVFLLLSEKAARLPGVPLRCWLFKVVRYASANALRARTRRDKHERQAAMMKTESSCEDSDHIWSEVAPVLDELMERLRVQDRDALLLRFYERKSLAEVGAAMGVSEGAAKERVARAVEKLRKLFRSRGVNVSAGMLATICFTQTTHVAAPALILGSSAASVGAVSIAKGTAGMLVTAKLKLAAMLLLTISVIPTGVGVALYASGVIRAAAPAPSASVASSANTAPSAPAAAASIAAPATAAIPDPAATIQMVRWDVLLNDNGLDAIKQAGGQPVQTDSKGYQVMRFDAETLRAAIVQAEATNGVIGVDQTMGVSQDNSGQFGMFPFNFVNYDIGMDAPAGLQGNIQGTESDQNVVNDRIHLKLDYSQFSIQIMKRNDQGYEVYQTQGQHSITYEGTLDDGEALAVIGDYAGRAGLIYRHLIVWEVFQAEPQRMGYFRNIHNPRWWCENGPEGMNGVINTALVWTAGAKHEASTVAPQFERKLEDGKVLRLTGLTRMDKWPFCWWDGQGQPVAEHRQMSLNGSAMRTPMWCAVEISGPTGEWPKQYPVGPPYPNDHAPGDVYAACQIFQSEDMRQLTVGVPVGPWERVGEINKGGTITVGDTTFQFFDLNANDDNSFNAQFYQVLGQSAPQAVTLTVVGKDGAELNPAFLNQIFSRNYGYGGPIFQGMSPSNVKTFHVWKRKIQWVTFDHLLAEPPTPPKTEITPAELAAAKAIEDQRQHADEAKQIEARFHLRQEKRKQWEGVPADPTTPRGALRAIFDAAEKGDLAGVRRRMLTSKDDPNHIVDLFARWITAETFVPAMIAKHFGEAALADVNIPNVPADMDDLELDLISASWQPWGDGGLEGDGTFVLRGSDGQFYWDIPSVWKTQNPRQSDQMLRPMIEAMERAGQLLTDNPKMTLEEFQKALQQPAAARSPGKKGD